MNHFDIHFWEIMLLIVKSFPWWIVNNYNGVNGRCRFCGVVVNFFNVVWSKFEIFHIIKDLETVYHSNHSLYATQQTKRSLTEIICIHFLETSNLHFLRKEKNLIGKTSTWLVTKWLLNVVFYFWHSSDQKYKCARDQQPFMLKWFFIYA